MEPNRTADDLPGISLIEETKFDEAIEFFRRRLKSGTALTYYGLATAIFRKRSILLTKEEALEIIGYYEKAISKRPDFADAYLMYAMSHEKMAGILLREYKKEPKLNPDEKIDLIKWNLTKAKELMETAVELNPNFRDKAEPELKFYERRMKGLDVIRTHFED